MRLCKQSSCLLAILMIAGIIGCGRSPADLPPEIPPTATRPSAIEPTSSLPPSTEIATIEPTVVKPATFPPSDTEPTAVVPTYSATRSAGDACETRWPRLLEVQPVNGAPGSELTIIGAEGYRYCNGLYNESSRDFLLMLDQVEIGTINCYANRCQAQIHVPEDIAPGSHTITAEGGSQISFEILDS